MPRGQLQDVTSQDRIERVRQRNHGVGLGAYRGLKRPPQIVTAADLEALKSEAQVSGSVLGVPPQRRRDQALGVQHHRDPPRPG
jgi:hypothetical protein